MRTFLFILILALPMTLKGQKFQRLDPNAQVFGELASGYPYSLVSFGISTKNHLSVAVVGNTDGGRIWKHKNNFSDFASLCVLRTFPSYKYPRWSTSVGAGLSYPTTFLLQRNIYLDDIGGMVQGTVNYSLAKSHVLNLRAIAFSPNLAFAPPGIMLGYRLQLRYYRSNNGVF